MGEAGRQCAGRVGGPVPHGLQSRRRTLAADLTTLALVTCYGGDDRRYESPGFQRDRAHILRQWDEALERTGCQADVCFVSHGGDAAFGAYLGKLRDRYFVLDRENVGHQQGGWQQGFEAFPGYDRYLIFDDDYIPVLPHFDRVLGDLITELGCGYLCQHLWGGQVPMMNGIMTASFLERLGGFPGAAGVGQAAADQAQGDLGQAARAAGLDMRDLGDRFRVLIPGERRHRDYDHYPDKPLLFVPSQWYHQVGADGSFDFGLREDPS